MYSSSQTNPRKRIHMRTKESCLYYIVENQKTEHRTGYETFNDPCRRCEIYYKSCRQYFQKKYDFKRK